MRILGRTAQDFWFIPPEDHLSSRWDRYATDAKHFPGKGTLVWYDKSTGEGVIVNGEYKGWIGPFIWHSAEIVPVSPLEQLAQEAE